MIDFASEFGGAVKRHLDEDYFIWLTTVDSKLRPQPRPVWFIWQEGSFLIFSEPQAHKVRHVTEHAHVALHFNTADAKAEQDVIVFAGTAIIDSTLPPAHQIPAYLKKYRTGIKDLGMSLEEFGEKYSVAIRVQSISVRG
ncbi:MAG TPA: TIGR03667 family PPOX class F420-dependent oxidoreductase [Anaerolineales bacterium]|nr:TIGR03667 family PPOX class F420-dependent oxidoreductase [Anaerolineales bacterium]